jgi:excisionase family DNA binding protein
MGVTGVNPCNPPNYRCRIAALKHNAVMETITFDQLPQAVGRLQEQLNHIEQLLLQRRTRAPETDDLLTISEAAKFLNLSIPTIYTKVSRKEIPVNKKGKRLDFYKSELAGWIKTGRKKTTAEITLEVEQSIIPKRNHQ